MDPRGPFCSHALGGLWRGQWGYATDHDEMRTAISTCRAGMDEAGWLKPLDLVCARVKVEEALNSVIGEETQKLAILKCPSEAKNVCGEQPSAKHAQLASDLDQEEDLVFPANHDEICAIGVAAALEAETLL